MKKIILLYIVLFNLLGTSLFANFYANFYSPTEDFRLCYYTMFQNANHEITTKDFFGSLLNNCSSSANNDVAYTLQQCFYFDFLNRYPAYAKNNSSAKAQDLATKKALNTCNDLVGLYKKSVKNNQASQIEEMIEYSKIMAFDFIKP